MRDLRILFMGTPEFATHILQEIKAANYNIVGVVTAPDKPAGRGRQLHQSHVKQYVLKENLNILQPTNLKSSEFEQQLKTMQPNLIVVVAFRMLPKSVWMFPKYGTFNLHASLLPQYRGAAPIHWAIINGEEKTGVTTFFIDEKIDTGEIILKKETAIEDHETVGQLHDKLKTLGATAVIDTLELIQNDTVKTQKQTQTGTLKTAYKLNNENTRIDWTLNIDTIFNKIRGLNPFPTAWTQLHNDSKPLRTKIYDIEKIYENHNHSAGKIIANKDSLKVAVEGGYIVILSLQLPGKRKMSAKDILNGFQFSKDAYFV